MIHTLTQGHGLPMVAPAAILRRGGRVHFDKRSASFFRFARQSVKKSCPRCIVDALSQTMIMRHAVDMQIFHTDHPEVVDDLPAFLMGKIVTSELHPFVNPCHNLTMFSPLRCALSKFGVFALHFRQGFLLLAEKARVGYLFFLGERSECLQPNVDTNLRSNRFKAKRLTLARKADVPLSCRRPLHRTGFHLAHALTMVDHFDGANLGEAHPLIMRGRLGGCPGDRDNGDNAKATLREGETVISAFALEARIARLLGMFSDSTKECLESQINTNGNVLQDLGMDPMKGRAFLFQDRERILLLKTGERNTIAFIGRFPHLQQVIIEPTALFKGVVELLFLLLRGKDAVLKHFQHSVIVAQTEQGCKRGTALYLSPRQDSPPPNKERTSSRRLSPGAFVRSKR